MARTTSTSRRTRREAPDPAASGFGSMLRGSVNSMVGAAGLNLPLRAVERLTGAIEQATSMLERLERATVHLDELDPDFVQRLSESPDVLARMHEDTSAIRKRMDAIEAEVRGMRMLVEERFDRVPLLRSPRRARRAQQDTPPPGRRRA